MVIGLVFKDLSAGLKWEWATGNIIIYGDCILCYPYCDLRCNEPGCVKCNDLKSGSCLECLPENFLLRGTCVSYVWVIIPLLVSIFIVILLLVKIYKKERVVEVGPSGEGTSDVNAINSHNLSYELNNFEFTVIESDNNLISQNNQNNEANINNLLTIANPAVTNPNAQNTQGVEFKEPHLQTDQNQESIEANQFNIQLQNTCCMCSTAKIIYEKIANKEPEAKPIEVQNNLAIINSKEAEVKSNEEQSPNIQIDKKDDISTELYKANCGCIFCELHKNSIANNSKGVENEEKLCPKCNTKVVSFEKRMNNSCEICFEFKENLINFHKTCNLKVCKECRRHCIKQSKKCPNCRVLLKILYN